VIGAQLAATSAAGAAGACCQAAPLAAGDLLFCRSTEMGLLRLITQQKVMNLYSRQALTNAEASSFLAQVYQDPAVGGVDEPSTTRSLWLKTASTQWASPNVWIDGYLAALAISLGAEMVTFDQGFKSYASHG
jgi:predicted nucleic acid-binding protein